MSLPNHLDTKDQEPVNQFGHLYKQERESGDSSRDLIREECEGGREGKPNNKNEQMRTRRDQVAADVNQQLTWSQFREPGAN